MTDKQQPEAPAFCWATELAMTQQPVTLSVTEAREVSAEMQRLHAENETLHVERERNLNSIRVCNEIINKKNAELESLTTGYAAARLEIESLRGRSVAPDPRPVVEMCAKALAEELAAWDIDPPLHHVKEAHDACELWLAAIDAYRAMRAAQPAGAQQPTPSAAVALSDDLRDRLVAISEAVADQDDRAAQAMLREILAAPQPTPTPQADSQPAPVLDMAVMQLAESVGLIGPASRTHDLHAAVQRFHDLICVNATIKAAVMAADAIRGAATSARDYPPLPMQFACSGVFPVYSADQMRAYVDADRAARAPADSVTAPAATVIKKGAERQWMSERLGHLPDGIYSLYLAPPTQPAPASQWDALLAATSTALEVLQKHRQMKGDWPMGELGRRAAEELQAARHAIFNTARAAQEGR